MTNQDIDIFIEVLNKKYGNENLIYSSLGGRKYIKIVMDHWKQRSVYCFIDDKGNIYKAASWNTPAKHIRGNIFNSNPLEGCEIYSPKYLKR